MIPETGQGLNAPYNEKEGQGRVEGGLDGFDGLKMAYNVNERFSGGGWHDGFNGLLIDCIDG